MRSSSQGLRGYRRPSATAPGYTVKTGGGIVCHAWQRFAQGVRAADQQPLGQLVSVNADRWKKERRPVKDAARNAASVQPLTLGTGLNRPGSALAAMPGGFHPTRCCECRPNLNDSGAHGGNDCTAGDSAPTATGNGHACTMPNAPGRHGCRAS